MVLFGPTPPALWGPPRSGPHVAIWRGRTGSPHAGQPDPGLLAITVTDVLASIERVAPPMLTTRRARWKGAVTAR